MGFIHYSGGLQVHSSLLNVVLPFRTMWLCSRADLATLGFAISLVTSASVALADRFLIFFLPISFMMPRV